MNTPNTSGPHPFGKAVISFREAKGWKQYTLAKAAGRQASEVKRVEEAKGSPKIDTVIWVAQALEIDPRELFDRTLKGMGH